jgi:predicted phage tail protein
MQRTVMFAGPLADRFTHETFHLDCDDILMLLSGLEANFPGFRGELTSYRDVAFVKVKDGQAISVTEDHFPMNFGSADKIVVSAAEDGSAMAAAAYVFDALATYGALATVAAVVTYVAVSVAIAYAASAVMKSLSKSKDTTESTKAQNASSLYNGAQNIFEQGGAIPLIYGRHRVGGTVISSEITTDRLPAANPDTFSVTSGGTFINNVTQNDVLREHLSVSSFTVDNVGSFAAGATYSTGSGTTEQRLSIATDGTLTLTTGSAVAGTIAGGYTANDSTTGTQVSTRYSIAVTAAPAAWTNTDPTYPDPGWNYNDIA